MNLTFCFNFFDADAAMKVAGLKNSPNTPAPDLRFNPDQLHSIFTKGGHVA
jgi:hypothetical protein